MTTTEAPTNTLPTTLIEGRHLRTRLDGTVQVPCNRCGDADGYIAQYNHVQGGTCFECGGYGGPWVTVKEATATYKRRDADKRRRDAKKAAKVNKVAADCAAFLTAHPELAGMGDSEHYIVSDMFDRLSRFGSLSDKQVELAARILRETAEREAQRAAERAAAEPAPTGRVEVIGEVISIKRYEDNYSFHGGITYKMTVKADAGYRVSCTVPSDLRPGVTTVDYGDEVSALRGRRVAFTATLTPSEDDATFAKAKRPTKARIAE